MSIAAVLFLVSYIILGGASTVGAPDQIPVPAA
jgi:hypothetical protein